MNLFSLLRRAPSGTAILQRRQNDARLLEIARAAELSRASWLNALLVDQTRAWLSIGEADADVLSGLAVMLTIAGFCYVYDSGQAAVDSPRMAVLRGGISAATQCSAAGCKVSVNDARAFSSACTRANEIIASCSVRAIVHAAESIRTTVGLANAASRGVGAVL